MNFRKGIKTFWELRKRDDWKSLLFWIPVILITIKFIIFPILYLITGTSLPIVIVESCSMYHGSSIDKWWGIHGDLYALYNISKEQFQEFPFVGGLNKGDIIIVWKKKEYHKGDIIVFNANSGSSQMYPIIHRIIKENPFGTKGDNNNLQLVTNTDFSNNKAKVDETNIIPQRIQGKAIARIPYLGWIKLFFFDFFKRSEERGLCKETTQQKL
ncbi:MAG: hypothetical protein AABY00_03975 [Nanoarchaeota archaeon]